jgi:hypothetical protein
MSDESLFNDELGTMNDEFRLGGGFWSEVVGKLLVSGRVGIALTRGTRSRSWSGA